MTTKPCSECGADAPAGPFVYTTSLDAQDWLEKYHCPRCGCTPAHNVAAGMREMWDRFERQNAPRLAERADLRALVDQRKSDAAAIVAEHFLEPGREAT